MQEKYLLTQTKLNDFYKYYNSFDQETGLLVKDIFDYQTIKNNTFIFNNHTKFVYDKLMGMIFECFKDKLKLIYEVLYQKENDDIHEIMTSLPDAIIVFLNKYNVTVENIMTSDLSKFFHFTNYVLYLDEILGMMFEPVKYEEMRKKFLMRDEGKEEKILLEQFKNNELNSIKG